MSLTSYRAAPPRGNPLCQRLRRRFGELIRAEGKKIAGSLPARRLCSNGATAWEGLACLPSRARIARLVRAWVGSIFTRKAGVRPDLPVGEGLAGAARDIPHEARGGLEDRAPPDASAVHEYRKDIRKSVISGKQKSRNHGFRLRCSDRHPGS